MLTFKEFCLQEGLIDQWRRNLLARKSKVTPSTEGKPSVKPYKPQRAGSVPNDRSHIDHGPSYHTNDKNYNAGRGKWNHILDNIPVDEKRQKRNAQSNVPSKMTPQKKMEAQ